MSLNIQGVPSRAAFRQSRAAPAKLLKAVSNCQWAKDTNLSVFIALLILLRLLLLQSLRSALISPGVLPVRDDKWGAWGQPSVGAVERLRHGGLSKPSQLPPWIISDVACVNPGIAGDTHTHSCQ